VTRRRSDHFNEPAAHPRHIGRTGQEEPAVLPRENQDTVTFGRGAESGRAVADLAPVKPAAEKCSATLRSDDLKALAETHVAHLMGGDCEVQRAARWNADRIAQEKTAFAASRHPLEIGHSGR